jgi:Cytochrome c oxidase subunit IV
MAEELRFFVRLALYLIIADAIYWFATYEWVGTVLMGTMAAGAIFFAVAAGLTVRAWGLPRGSVTYASGSPPARSGLLGRLDRTLGFGEPLRADTALVIEEEPLPPASIWPLVAAVGALLLALGLVYGAWFWLPGGAVMFLALWGWLTELSQPV